MTTNTAHTHLMVALARSGLPDLTNRQMALVLLINDGPPSGLTASELAVTLNISKPAVSRGLTTLTRLNLIRRTPDSADGRRSFIKPGPAASDLVTELDQVLASLEHRLVAAKLAPST